MAKPENHDFLQSLEKVLKSRIHDDPTKSYVAGLFAKGNEKIAKKIGEEATETVIATMQGNHKAIVHETADLWFHTMVMLVHNGLSVEDIIQELNRRFGVSGLEEKASRDIL